VGIVLRVWRCGGRSNDILAGVCAGSGSRVVHVPSFLLVLRVRCPVLSFPLGSTVEFVAVSDVSGTLGYGWRCRCRVGDVLSG